MKQREEPVREEDDSMCRHHESQVLFSHRENQFYRSWCAHSKQIMKTGEPRTASGEHPIALAQLTWKISKIQQKDPCWSSSYYAWKKIAQAMVCIILLVKKKIENAIMTLSSSVQIGSLYGTTMSEGTSEHHLQESNQNSIWDSKWLQGTRDTLQTWISGTWISAEEET